MEKYRKLKGKIVEKYGTQKKFLESSPIKRSSFIARMKGKIPFQIDEVKKISELLEIKNDEIAEYFF